MAGPAGAAGPFWQAVASASNGKVKQRANFKRTELHGILVPLPGMFGRFSVEYTESVRHGKSVTKSRLGLSSKTQQEEYLLLPKSVLRKIFLIKIAGIDAFAGQT
jgi:hypothetical protein